MAARFIAVLLAVLVAGYVADEAAWRLRGSQVRSASVSIVTAMEFKNGKEDYGEPDVELVTCGVRELPGFSNGAVVSPCWWVQRHTQVVRRP